jgi:glucosamine--fructose-6-phosphate aminotransferase (isomerizing)
MCGIVGYIGNRNGSDIVIAGLKALEYRGYDSAGIALLDGKARPKLVKQVGRVDGLEQLLKAEKPGKAPIAIGHTRWATHGKPSVINAHPHSNTSRDIFVVHNGIIENYMELKEWLQEKGYTFASETDTEVVPHLIDYYRKKTGSFAKAFASAIAEIRGAYAIVAYERARSR